jgi:hypothetical protein
MRKEKKDEGPAVPIMTPLTTKMVAPIIEPVPMAQPSKKDSFWVIEFT